jgi:hypothetical protein
VSRLLAGASEAVTEENSPLAKAARIRHSEGEFSPRNLLFSSRSSEKQIPACGGQASLRSG